MYEVARICCVLADNMLLLGEALIRYLSSLEQCKVVGTIALW